MHRATSKFKHPKQSKIAKRYVEEAQHAIQEAAKATRIPIMNTACDVDMINDVKKSISMFKRIESVPNTSVKKSDVTSAPKEESHGARCWGCNTAAVDLQLCSGCSIARYCSHKCQQKHWAEHKIICRQVTSSPVTCDAVANGSVGNVHPSTKRQEEHVENSGLPQPGRSDFDTHESKNTKHHVTLTGLQAHPHLNGVAGLILRSLPDSHRHAVLLETGEVKSLKLDNLKRFSPPQMTKATINPDADDVDGLTRHQLKGFGTCFRANRSIGQGDIIFTEKPVCLIRRCQPPDGPGPLSQWMSGKSFRSPNNPDVVVRSFQSLSDKTKRSILEEFRLDACKPEMQEFNRQLASEAKRCGSLRSGKTSDLAKFLDIVALHANEALSVQGVALYRFTAKLPHSCQPVASYTTTDGVLTMRALHSIRPGELITTSYLAGPILLSPRFLRRSMLNSTWAFKCTCSRCGEHPVADSIGDKEQRLMALAMSPEFTCPRARQLGYADLWALHKLAVDELGDLHFCGIRTLMHIHWNLICERRGAVKEMAVLLPDIGVRLCTMLLLLFQRIERWIMAQVPTELHIFLMECVLPTVHALEAGGFPHDAGLLATRYFQVQVNKFGMSDENTTRFQELFQGMSEEGTSIAKTCLRPGCSKLAKVLCDRCGLVPYCGKVCKEADSYRHGFQCFNAEGLPPCCEGEYKPERDKDRSSISC